MSPEQAFQFIMENKIFFLAPLVDPNGFKAWIEQGENSRAISALNLMFMREKSGTFSSANAPVPFLNSNTEPLEYQYIEALLGTKKAKEFLEKLHPTSNIDNDRTVIGLLEDDSGLRLKQVLEENPALCRVVESISAYPEITDLRNSWVSFSQKNTKTNSSTSKILGELIAAEPAVKPASTPPDFSWMLPPRPKPEQQLSSEIEEVISVLVAKVDELQEKAKENPQYIKAAELAQEMATKIKIAVHIHNTLNPDLELFKKNCRDAITPETRSVLETHRSWKGVFVQFINTLLKPFCSEEKANTTDSAQVLKHFKQSLSLEEDENNTPGLGTN